MGRIMFGERLINLSRHNPNAIYGEWVKLNHRTLRMLLSCAKNNLGLDALEFFEEFEVLVQAGLVEISGDGRKYRLAHGFKQDIGETNG